MAFGDIGGAVTELVITCETPTSGTVDIVKGDAVKLAGNYTVTNVTDAEDAVFGQAMADAEENGVAIPVKVRGICVFPYMGAAPTVDGVSGVVASASEGEVKAPGESTGSGVGLNLKVDTEATLVHVLL